MHTSATAPVRATTPRQNDLKFDAVPTPFAPSPPAPALQALRAATRIRHAHIDQLMNLRLLARRDHYTRVLQAFDAFLGPWETSVRQALPARWHGWLQQRSRCPFLQADLQRLGVPAIARAPGLALATPAAAWGSLYVLEGSALGGQVITRALAQAGVPADAGGAYFHGWGTATAAMWRDFRHLLEAELATPGALPAACAAACLTFDALAALLTSHLHERTALA